MAHLFKVFTASKDTIRFSYNKLNGSVFQSFKEFADHLMIEANYNKNLRNVTLQLPGAANDCFLIHVGFVTDTTSVFNFKLSEAHFLV